MGCRTPSAVNHSHRPCILAVTGVWPRRVSHKPVVRNAGRLLTVCRGSFPGLGCASCSCMAALLMAARSCSKSCAVHGPRDTSDSKVAASARESAESKRSFPRKALACASCTSSAAPPASRKACTACRCSSSLSAMLATRQTAAQPPLQATEAKKLQQRLNAAADKQAAAEAAAAMGMANCSSGYEGRLGPRALAAAAKSRFGK